MKWVAVLEDNYFTWNLKNEKVVSRLCSKKDIWFSGALMGNDTAGFGSPVGFLSGALMGNDTAGFGSPVGFLSGALLGNDTAGFGSPVGFLSGGLMGNDTGCFQHMECTGSGTQSATFKKSHDIMITPGHQFSK